LSRIRDRVVIGLFDGVEEAAAAVRALFDVPLPAGDVTTISPVPLPDGAVVTDPKPITFPWIVASLWLVGAVSGIALALITYHHYPLVTAGKPITTIPPTIIVAYELAMLAAILTTLASGFRAIGLPRFRKKKAFDPRIYDGKIAVCARVATDEQALGAIEAMRAAGGIDVREEEGEL
jgi:hypothetical protein